jgi:hypothetical protein
LVHDLRLEMVAGNPDNWLVIPEKSNWKSVELELKRPLPRGEIPEIAEIGPNKGAWEVSYDAVTNKSTLHCIYSPALDARRHPKYVSYNPLEFTFVVDNIKCTKNLIPGSFDCP